MSDMKVKMSDLDSMKLRNDDGPHKICLREYSSSSRVSGSSSNEWHIHQHWSLAHHSVLEGFVQGSIEWLAKLAPWESQCYRYSAYGFPKLNVFTTRSTDQVPWSTNPGCAAHQSLCSIWTVKMLDQLCLSRPWHHSMEAVGKARHKGCDLNNRGS